MVIVISPLVKTREQFYPGKIQLSGPNGRQKGTDLRCTIALQDRLLISFDQYFSGVSILVSFEKNGDATIIS